MIVTKDIWLTLSDKDKKTKVTEALEQLYTIQECKHSLSKTREQGRLAGVKKDLEAFILNAAEWESNRQLQKQFS